MDLRTRMWFKTWVLLQSIRFHCQPSIKTKRRAALWLCLRIHVRDPVMLFNCLTPTIYMISNWLIDVFFSFLFRFALFFCFALLFVCFDLFCFALPCFIMLWFVVLLYCALICCFALICFVLRFALFCISFVFLLFCLLQWTGPQKLQPPFPPLQQVRKMRLYRSVILNIGWMDG